MRTIIITEEQYRKILIKEQSNSLVAYYNSFCLFGTCRTDIRIVDKTTAKILEAKAGESENPDEDKGKKESLIKAIKQLNKLYIKGIDDKTIPLKQSK